MDIGHHLQFSWQYYSLSHSHKVIGWSFCYDDSVIMWPPATGLRGHGITRNEMYTGCIMVHSISSIWQVLNMDIFRRGPLFLLSASYLGISGYNLLVLTGVLL